MAAKTLLSRRAFEAIVKGLVQLEELLEQTEYNLAAGGDDGDAGAAGPPPYLRTYIAQVENWLQRAEVADAAELPEDGGQAPFVMIGAPVQIVNRQTGGRLNLRLVSPRQAEDDQQDRAVVSILSPLGRALLLAPPGSTLTVAEADGPVEYYVVAAGYPV